MFLEESAVPSRAAALFVFFSGIRCAIDARLCARPVETLDNAVAILAQTLLRGPEALLAYFLLTRQAWRGVNVIGGGNTGSKRSTTS